MLARYVLADLGRNPRRTLSTVVGVTLGIGLFCGILFFVDGLSASMTQRAVAPLAIDMQRIITVPTGASVSMTQAVDSSGPLARGAQVTVDLLVTNAGELAAHEVTVRSQPVAALTFVPGSARLDGVPITTVDDNPLSHGPGQTGLNLGTVEPGAAHRLTYRVEASTDSPGWRESCAAKCR